MNEWEAQRAMVAASVAAVDLQLRYKHDLLRVAATLEAFIESYVRQFVGVDYLNYGALLKPVESHLSVIANERGFATLQDYWDAKIEGYM